MPNTRRILIVDDDPELREALTVLDGHDDPQSRHKFVAAGFGNQDCGRGRILFDLLPQAVNMRLQRMRRDAGIIAPDFLQHSLARNGFLPGTEKIAQDRGLLLGQPDLVAVGMSKILELGRNVWGPIVNTASSLASCWRS
jgi:hypothetical protein